MNIEDNHALLCMCLGTIAGILLAPEGHARLVQSLKAGNLDAEYVRLVRDKLALALEAAEVFCGEG